MKKKTLSEQVTIRNLTTRNKMTVIDDAGNIAADIPSEPGEDDYKFDFIDSMGDDEVTGSGDHLRPDGTPDGLDGDLEDEFADYDVDSEVGFDDAGNSDGGMLDDEAVPSLEPQGEEDNSEFGDMGEEGMESEEDIDPDYQGVVRTVKGAYLTYKRKMEDGTYEELWVYNINKNFKTETKIRRSVLAGTDISPQDVTSEDGTQQAQTTTVGNVQFLKITGLPN